jgi:hypothetical protein
VAKKARRGKEGKAKIKRKKNRVLSVAAVLKENNLIPALNQSHGREAYDLAQGENDEGGPQSESDEEDVAYSEDDESIENNVDGGSDDVQEEEIAGIDRQNAKDATFASRTQQSRKNYADSLNNYMEKLGQMKRPTPDDNLGQPVKTKKKSAKTGKQPRKQESNWGVYMDSLPRNV